MTLSGLKAGLTNGNLQGLKLGSTFSQIKSGLKGNGSNVAGKNYQIQNPISLSGNKLPWIYMNADDAEVNSNATLIPDVLNLGYKWSVYYNDSGYNNGTKHPSITIDGEKIILGSNISSGNRPFIKQDGSLGQHKYLDFGGSSGSSTVPWLAPLFSLGTEGYGKLEYSRDETGSFSSSITIIMVMRSKLNSDKTLLNIANNQSPTSANITVNGAISIYQNSATTLSSYCWGDTFGEKRSVYQTGNLLVEIQDWMIITAKYNFKDPMKLLGLGSEQAFYVNGKFQHYLVSNDWDTFSSNPTTVFQPSQPFTIGTDDSSNGTGANGMDLAAMIVYPRWLNESEQFATENYFRWYYNKSF